MASRVANPSRSSSLRRLQISFCAGQVFGSSFETGPFGLQSISMNFNERCVIRNSTALSISFSHFQRHHFGRFANSEVRKFRPDRISDVVRREVRVVLLGHARVGVTELLGDDALGTPRIAS